jgi:CheY-like chemotaxis protein
MNLLTNCAESISQSGSVRLTTFGQVPDQELANRLDLEMVLHTVLRVSDSGPCIPETDLNHIFEPFYTKRAMGKKSGTGLGLSVVWNTLKDHAGAVAAASTDKGTRFDLYFPACAETVTTPAMHRHTQDLRGDGETILVIDDELHQCHLARKILEYYGYEVAYKNSGEEAIEYLTSHQADLLILDMIMAPGINGRQTYAEILKIHPEQRAIIASGFSESEDVKATLRMGAGTFIKKPYTMKELALAVRNALRKQRSRAEESADASRPRSPASIGSR